MRAPGVERASPLASVGVCPGGARLVLLVLAAALPQACHTRADYDQLIVSGTVEAIELDLSTEVSGVLLERPVDEGAVVAKGQVIARVDPALYQIRVQETEAALRESQANLARSLRGFRREEILGAAEQAREAEAEVGNAQANLTRAEELWKQQIVGQAELDSARRTSAVSQARFASARQNYQKLSAGLRVEDIDAARATVARLQAILDRARLDLTRSEIRAPMRGMVTEVRREPGEFVPAGGPILTIADLENLYCWVYLPAVDVGQVRIGDRVQVRVDAYPARAFPGVVAYVSPEAEFTPKSVQTREERVNLVFAVKVAVPNPDGSLKIGLPADVEIPRHPGGEPSPRPAA